MNDPDGFVTRFEFTVGDLVFAVLRNGLVYVRRELRRLDDGTEVADVQHFRDLEGAILGVLPCRVRGRR